MAKAALDLWLRAMLGTSAFALLDLPGGILPPFQVTWKDLHMAPS